ncbi:MAG: arylformamidase [Paenisporosarcina sp.]
MKIHDISMLLKKDTAEWPGDTPFQYQVNWSKEESGSVNVGKLVTSTHIGTHIDAPFHFDENGEKVHELALQNYLVQAVVIDVKGREKISREDIEHIQIGREKAVLFHTGSWNNRSLFPKEIPSFDLDIVEWMIDKGIILFGVDLPSVDAITSKDLSMHHALNRAGRYILEGLVLDKVKEGSYELIALPLNIEGADGSPVKAILIDRMST